MKKSKVIVAAVLFSAILVTVAFLLKPFFERIGKPEIVKVSYGTLDVTISGEGELISKSNVAISASSIFKNQVGVIRQIKIVSLVPEGKYVRAGEEVARLDKESVLNAIKGAQSDAVSVNEQISKAIQDSTTQLRDTRFNLSTLKINMEISQINMEQSLYDPPAAQRKTKLEFEKSKIAYEQAYQNYLQRKAQFESTISNLSANSESLLKKQAEIQKYMAATIVRSPRSGILSYYTDINGVKRTVGSSITPDDLVVALIPDLNNLVSECLFSEDELMKVSVSQKANVGVKILDDQKFDGYVSDISGIPVIQNGKKFYTVSIKLRGDLSKLRPRMTTINNIEVSKFNDVLYIPKTSLAEEGSKKFVFTKDLRKQEVEVGGTNGEFVTISKGLSKDEEIYARVPSSRERFKQINIE